MSRTILVFLLPAFVLAVRAKDGAAVPKVGGRTASGNLVLYVFREAKTAKPLPAELTTDYGFMVINVGSEEKPKPLYRLGCRMTGTVQDFDTLATFVAALAKLPKGSVLHQYDKCTVPTSWGIDFDQSSFAATCERLGLSLSDERHMTCTCPD
jgi:hypothetical protein